MIPVEVNYGTSVQSFGNSIPANYQIPEILASWLGGVADKKAIPNTGVKIINLYGYQYLPYGSRSSLVTWDGPLNDLRRHGAAALPCIAPALNAFISCAFMGGSRAASHPGVTRTGAWTALDVNHNGYGLIASRPHGGLSLPCGSQPMRTTDATATASFTFTGSRVAVHAFGSENSGGNDLYKNLKVAIDGACHVFEVEGKALPGEATCSAAKVFRGLGAGTHTITVTPCTGGNFTAFDSFVFPQPEGFAPVILAHAPYLLDWLNATPGLIDAANAIIDEVAAEWVADGFPVAVARTNDFYEPVRDSAEGIHPDAHGRRNYALSQMAVVRVK